MVHHMFDNPPVPRGVVLGCVWRWLELDLVALFTGLPRNFKIGNNIEDQIGSEDGLAECHRLFRDVTPEIWNLAVGFLRFTKGGKSGRNEDLPNDINDQRDGKRVWRYLLAG